MRRSCRGRRPRCLRPATSCRQGSSRFVKVSPDGPEDCGTFGTNARLHEDRLEYGRGFLHRSRGDQHLGNVDLVPPKAPADHPHRAHHCVEDVLRWEPPVDRLRVTRIAVARSPASMALPSASKSAMTTSTFDSCPPQRGQACEPSGTDPWVTCTTSSGCEIAGDHSSSRVPGPASDANLSPK